MKFFSDTLGTSSPLELVGSFYLMNKKSFLLFIDSLDILDEISDEQAGLLFKAIRSFNIGKELQLDITTRMLFLPFKNQFVRDNAKWEVIKEKRIAAGSEGGKQKVANATKIKQKVANSSKTLQDPPVSVSVSVKGNVSVTKGKKIPLPDSIDFKKEFADKLGWDKVRLKYYYDALLNYSNQGNKYIDWISAARQWAAKDEREGKVKFNNNVVNHDQPVN